MKLCYITVFFMIVSGLLAQNAQVKFVLGDAQTRSSKLQNDWSPLSLDQQLEEKDFVKTGTDSRAEILLPDQTVVKVMENSMMQLNFIPEPEKPETELFSWSGKFFFMVKKLINTKFEVKSPASVVAIRGTEFYLQNGESKSELWVRSGSVDFSDVNGTQMETVVGGQKSIIERGGAPSTPIDLTPEEKELMDSFVTTPQTEPEQQVQQETEMTEDTPPPPPPTTQTEETEPEKEEPSEGTNFGMGVAVGAVTIDNVLYNQIGLRPEFSFGKLGIALDLTLYIDQDGNIRKDNWDSADDIIEKIYYVRWGRKGDPFYAKVGAIDNYRLGYGILMNHYANTIQYPTIIRTGLETGFQGDKFGLDVMVNDFKEIGKPEGGLFAGRLTYKLIGNLEIGASVVFDRNQYAALGDKDGDGVPDDLDAFPNDKKNSKDTDGDGVPDSVDPDVDGDGYTDNTQDPRAQNNDFDGVIEAPDPFNIKTAEDKTQFAFAVDLGYPLLSMKYLNLFLYAQAAQFGHDGGWGIAAPGFLAKIAFIDFYGEYRIFGENFLPEYFSTTYELERSVYRIDPTTCALVPYTKRQLLENEITENLQGYLIGADFNLFDVLIFRAQYQNMSKTDIELNTLRGNLDLNTTFIPKIKSAGAYYYQQNVKEFFEKEEGTIMGYQVQYEISSGAYMLFDYRQTFRDLNGDGKIAGKGETLNTTNITTAFTF